MQSMSPAKSSSCTYYVQDINIKANNYISQKAFISARIRADFTRLRHFCLVGRGFHPEEARPETTVEPTQRPVRTEKK